MPKTIINRSIQGLKRDVCKAYSVFTFIIVKGFQEQNF